MSADPIPATRPARRRSPVTAGVVVVAALLGVLGWGKVRDAAAGPDASVPSCTWPSYVEHASSDQTELIRCYLRAIAHHDAHALRSVVRSTGNGGPAGFTDADFAHAADARTGPATVTVSANDADSAAATVSIRYADGARDEQELHLANPGSAHSWRFWSAGSYHTDPNAAPSAAS